MTLSELTASYGKPIYHLHLTKYSDDERLINDIPDQVCVFATHRTPQQIVVYGRVRKGEWLANYGYRALVRELLKRSKII